MRTLAFILSVVLFLQFHMLVAPVLADSVTITTSTSTAPAGLTGQMPVTKVGALLAADALAILNGTEITIQSSVKTGQTPHTLLQGTLLNTKPTAGGGATSTAYFTGGDNSYKLKPGSCPDKVTTISGVTYTGSLTSVTPTGVSMETSSGPQSIAAQDIAELHSARAYKVNISNLANNPKMDMSGTCIHSVAAAEKGNTAKKLIIVGLAVVLVATAIAVPVAVATASHHHHSNPFVPPVLVTHQVVPPPTLPAQLKNPIRGLTVPTRPSQTIVNVPIITKGTSTVVATQLPKQTVATTLTSSSSTNSSTSPSTSTTTTPFFPTRTIIFRNIFLNPSSSSSPPPIQ